MRVLVLCVVSLVAALAACDDDPVRCGTGALDPASGTCTCPEASHPASQCELPRDAFDVEAHRGARSTLPPGNTLPAFVEAIRVGADTLEGDLQITSDGYVVLNHDDALSAECVYAGPGTAPATRNVAELRADEIALFDCHPELPGIDAPPRLEAVLDLRTRANVGFDLELKKADVASVDAAMQVLAAYDAACGHCLTGRLLVQSFDAEALRHARATYGETLSFETSYLTLVASDEPATVAEFADVYAPLSAAVNASLVDAFHAAGLRVLPWTVDDESTMCTLIALGVDGLISNDPALAARVLRRCR